MGTPNREQLVEWLDAQASPRHDGEWTERSLERARWNAIPWEQDEEAQRIVNANPGGMTLEEISEVLGITRERVRQIEMAAIRKLRTACQKYGIQLPEELAIILERPIHVARPKESLSRDQRNERVRLRRAAGEWSR